MIQLYKFSIKKKTVTTLPLQDCREKDNNKNTMRLKEKCCILVFIFFNLNFYLK